MAFNDSARERVVRAFIALRAELDALDPADWGESAETHQANGYVKLSASCLMPWFVVKRARETEAPRNATDPLPAVAGG